MRRRRSQLPYDVKEWWVFDPTISREDYVRQVLDGYRATPTTCGQTRSSDRDLAMCLYLKKIPFTAVDGAFVLAAARRTYRNPTWATLAPIRSLRYFLPIIREILGKPVDPGEVSYLWWKMQGKH